MNTPKPSQYTLPRPKGSAMLSWYGKSPLKDIRWYPAQEKEIYGNKHAQDWNRILWGDNKQVLAHLLKDHRGKIDLIYIDPPFDSKANYVKKIQLYGKNVKGGSPNVLEEMQYTDIWEKDSYLQFLYERLILLRALLADTGSIYVHCDWHKNAHIRLIMDEVFGAQNFRNEIIWAYSGAGQSPTQFKRKHDTILFYTKTAKNTFHWRAVAQPLTDKQIAKYSGRDEKGRYKEYRHANGKTHRKYLSDDEKLPLTDVWTDIYIIQSKKERSGYPTQKPEKLLERIIKASSNKGDLVLDCFLGSGTTCAVAQRLGRRFIGCDINKGAIHTTTQRLHTILNAQKEQGVFEDKTWLGLPTFKIYNVNHYDVFNNEKQAMDLLMQAYKIEEISHAYFDGRLGCDFVKIVSPNRVLSKTDMSDVIQAATDHIELFEAQKTKKKNQERFKNKVIVLCSGLEPDVHEFVKMENHTGVRIVVRNIQVEDKQLHFKKPSEAIVEYKLEHRTLHISIQDYFSPLLMKKLSLHRETSGLKEHVSFFDFRQAISSIAIDTNYTPQGHTSFHAELFGFQDDKNEISTTYSVAFQKAGRYTIALKITDVLGEEYFETHETTVF